MKTESFRRFGLEFRGTVAEDFSLMKDVFSSNGTIIISQYVTYSIRRTAHYAELLSRFKEYQCGSWEVSKRMLSRAESGDGKGIHEEKREKEEEEEEEEEEGKVRRKREMTHEENRQSALERRGSRRCGHEHWEGVEESPRITPKVAYRCAVPLSREQMPVFKMIHQPLLMYPSVVHQAVEMAMSHGCLGNWHYGHTSVTLLFDRMTRHSRSTQSDTSYIFILTGPQELYLMQSLGTIQMMMNSVQIWCFHLDVLQKVCDANADWCAKAFHIPIATSSSSLSLAVEEAVCFALSFLQENSTPKYFK